MSRFQYPQRDQALNTLPDGNPAHAQGSRELVLRGQFAAGSPGAAEDLITKSPEDLATDAFFFDWLEHIHLAKANIPE